jgi:hypothetical protein
MMKKNNDRRLTGLTLFAAVLAVLLGMAGCGENQENAASEPEINRTEDGVYYDNGETFCRGVWAADDGENLLGYYVFADGENGRFEEIQMGMGIPFHVTAKGGDADFNLGAADFSDPAKIEITGQGKRTLTWTGDGRVEYLSLIGKQEPDTFRFYSRTDLDEMALDYYEALNGQRPTTAGIAIAADGTATIQLYGKNGDMITEYVVDVITGKGTVGGSEEEIQLYQMTTDD